MITRTGPNEIRFSDGDSVKDLALKVKAEYDKGSRRILIACQDPQFPTDVVIGRVHDFRESFDSPEEYFRWAPLLMQAFQEIGGLPPGGTLIDVENPKFNFNEKTYKPNAPYSRCLEYFPIH